MYKYNFCIFISISIDFIELERRENMEEAITRYHDAVTHEQNVHEECKRQKKDASAELQRCRKNIELATKDGGIETMQNNIQTLLREKQLILFDKDEDETVKFYFYASHIPSYRWYVKQFKDVPGGWISYTVTLFGKSVDGVVASNLTAPEYMLWKLHKLPATHPQMQWWNDQLAKSVCENVYRRRILGEKLHKELKSVEIHERCAKCSCEVSITSSWRTLGKNMCTRKCHGDPKVYCKTCYQRANKKKNHSVPLVACDRCGDLIDGADCTGNRLLDPHSAQSHLDDTLSYCCQCAAIEQNAIDLCNRVRNNGLPLTTL